VRRDFALGELSNAFLQLKLFIVELEIHDAVSVSALLRIRIIWIRTQPFQGDKVTAGRWNVWGGHPCPPLLILEVALKTFPHPAPIHPNYKSN